MSEIIQIIRDRPGRYVLVGIPCFIKAVRLLMKEDPLLGERIRFCIGLICGHLKSIRFAEMFAWQCGVEPGKLLAVDFRKKLPDADANKYGVEVVGLENGKLVTRTRPVQDMYGYDWGLGFFKYKACDYCDDVVAETADVTVGDAWLPQYIKDSQGTNVIVVRHPIIHNMLERAIAAGNLKLDLIDAEEVVRSQKSGFAHRHDGLAYRLYLADTKGKWRPKKRIQPSKRNIERNFQKRYLMRMLLAKESHDAFKKAVEVGQFSVFVEIMEPLVRQYRALSQPPTWKQFMWQFKGFVKHLLNAFI
ncbi:MAG: hypothetical protein KatS3mg066_1915 [Fischerella sp.]|nr:MAG: hypothetical protein KatS3mg066_1915 [Fischerella sp.]